MSVGSALERPAIQPTIGTDRALHPIKLALWLTQSVRSWRNRLSGNGGISPIAPSAGPGRLPRSRRDPQLTLALGRAERSRFRRLAHGGPTSSGGCRMRGRFGVTSALSAWRHHRASQSLLDRGNGQEIARDRSPTRLRPAPRTRHVRARRTFLGQA